MTDHTHTIDAGDELYDAGEGTRLHVEDVADDGAVTYVAIDDDGAKYYDTRATVPADEIATALDEGIISTDE